METYTVWILRGKWWREAIQVPQNDTTLHYDPKIEVNDGNCLFDDDENEYDDDDNDDATDEDGVIINDDMIWINITFSLWALDDDV